MDAGDPGIQALHHVPTDVDRVLIPLPPAVGRALDAAIGDRITGPILLNRRGARMDRHAAPHVRPADRDSRGLPVERCLKESTGGAMDGWTSVEELTRWAFARSPVVMANEAHDGLARCVRTRQVGVRIVKASHQLGVRRLAMEALPWPGDGTAGPIRQVPRVDGGYLAQPDMQELIMTALNLGWTLWAYEAAIENPADIDPADLISMEFTNWREREQARNLCSLLNTRPIVPLLVWCGNGHAFKQSAGDWTPMGCHFTAMSGIEPFVIDQTVSVDWPQHREDHLPTLLASLADILRSFDGTAGILRGQAPAPWDALTGADAVIASTHNNLTGADHDQ